MKATARPSRTKGARCAEGRALRGLRRSSATWTMSYAARDAGAISGVL